jgi:hypothetical protein
MILKKKLDNIVKWEYKEIKESEITESGGLAPLKLSIRLLSRKM